MLAQNDYNLADLDFLKKEIGIKPEDIQQIQQKVEQNLDTQAIVSEVLQQVANRQPYINDVTLDAMTLVSYTESEDTIQSSGQGYAWKTATEVNKVLDSNFSATDQPSVDLKPDTAYLFTVQSNTQKQFANKRLITPTFRHDTSAVCKELECYCVNSDYQSTQTSLLKIVVYNRSSHTIINFKLAFYVRLRVLGL